MSTEPTPVARPRSAFSAKRLADLDLATRVADEARRPSHAATLAAHEITTVFAQTLADDVAQCRGAITRLLAQSSERSIQTATEGSWRSKIEGAVQEIQAAARQKHFTDPHRTERLKPYSIGSPLSKQSRAVLTQTTEAILQTLTTDPLPGITPEKIAALQSALTAWNAADFAQHGAQEGALLTRAEINTLLDSIAQRRQTVQFAADAAWPARNSNNAETRALFGLPRTRPYSPKL